MEKLRPRKGKDFLEINNLTTTILVIFFNLSGLQQSPSIYGFVRSALSGLICQGQYLAQKESKAKLWLSAAAGTVRMLIYT